MIVAKFEVLPQNLFAEIEENHEKMYQNSLPPGSYLDLKPPEHT